jgi:prephenate dehydrogenase
VNDSRLTGPIKIVGTGLIGTSIGLALRSKGLEVLLEDTSPAVLSLAIDFGAGSKYQIGTKPELVIVCTTPDVTAQVVAAELKSHPMATVTDVASVKGTILTSLQEHAIGLSNYVGSHPMAGREQTGALAGRGDLFIGRPWVITPNSESSRESILVVESLAHDLGASAVSMDPIDHDRAVALVSHAPQIVSSLLAARLASADTSDVSLAGQGLRDTTRIAASDPRLWIQILSANNQQVSDVLRNLKNDLDQIIEALQDPSKPGSLTSIGKLLESGNLGVAKIPGKHGSSATKYAKVTVMIDDKPGELAKLLTEIGQIGINLEDLTLEHAAGAQVGLPELYVLPTSEAELVSALTERGWKIVG